MYKNGEQQKIKHTRSVTDHKNEPERRIMKDIYLKKERFEREKKKNREKQRKR